MAVKKGRRGPAYLTVRQFCDEYNVGVSSAYGAIRSGRLKAVATGASKGYRIRREEAERFMGAAS